MWGWRWASLWEPGLYGESKAAGHTAGRSRLGLRVSRGEMVVLKSQVQAGEPPLTLRLWTNCGQVQDLCCTAEVIGPALTLVLAKLLTKAVKTPSSLVSPPTSPLLMQRPHYKRGSFLCQSPASLKAPTLSMHPWRTCDGGSSLSPGQL